MEQGRGTQQSDVGKESFDPVVHQVGTEQTGTEQVLTKFLVVVSLQIFTAFAFLYFGLATIAVSTTTITRPRKPILTFSSKTDASLTFSSNDRCT